MRARFAALRAGRMTGGSASKDLELLKSVEDSLTGVSQSVVEALDKRLKLETLLAQASSLQTPRTMVRFCVLSAFVASIGAYLIVHFLTVSVVVGAIGFYLPVFWLRFRAKKRTTALNRVLPEVADMISRAMRAGHSVSAALGIVAEEAPEPARSGFGDVFQKQKFGLPLRDALLEMVRCFPSEDLKVLVTAILVQRDTGGNLVQILERTAAVIRERQKLAGDVRVHTAQGRLTGWILCLLPVLMLGVLTVTNPSYPKVLLDDPLGRKLLYVGLALLCIGGLLIQRIVKGIEV